MTFPMGPERGKQIACVAWGKATLEGSEDEALQGVVWQGIYEPFAMKKAASGTPRSKQKNPGKDTTEPGFFLSHAGMAMGGDWQQRGAPGEPWRDGALVVLIENSRASEFWVWSGEESPRRLNVPAPPESVQLIFDYWYAPCGGVCGWQDGETGKAHLALACSPEGKKNKTNQMPSALAIWNGEAWRLLSMPHKDECDKTHVNTWGRVEVRLARAGDSCRALVGSQFCAPNQVLVLDWGSGLRAVPMPTQFGLGGHPNAASCGHPKAGQ